MPRFPGNSWFFSNGYEAHDYHFLNLAVDFKHVCKIHPENWGEMSPNFDDFSYVSDGLKLNQQLVNRTTHQSSNFGTDTWEGHLSWAFTWGPWFSGRNPAQFYRYL